MTADLYGQLDEARRLEAEAFEAKEIINGKLSAAVAAQEYAQAEELKVQLPGAELAWAQAKAQADGLRGAVEHLEAEERRRREEAELAERRRQARAQCDDAVVRQQAARDEAEAHWADVRPGVDAVRESMRAAVEAYGRSQTARQQAHEALVTLGEAEPAGRYGESNDALTFIGEDKLLYAIYHGRTL